MLEVNKSSHAQRILGEITCVLYPMWRGTILWTLGNRVGFGGRGKYILLTEAKMSIILYLHGEAVQLLCYMTARDHLAGGRGYMSQSKGGDRS